MTASSPTDIHGVEIEVGDLVVSAGVVGTVKGINGWGSINVRHKSKRNVYAYEDGAPDIAYQYTPRTYNWQTREYTSGPEETCYRKDRRVIGEKTVNLTQVRVNKSDILILQKHDGSVPNALAEIIKHHDLIFLGGNEDNE